MQPASESITRTADGPNAALVEVLALARTERGRTLLELVDSGTVMLVLLRHFGCSYCRQSISDVAAISSELAARRVQPVFVHLGTPERAKPYFDYYGLSEVERISDPQATIYTSPAFALTREHPLSHFLKPKNWAGWLSGSLQKHGIGMIREDAHQMPGIFVLRDRAIVGAFRFKHISDQPDYLALIPSP
jgi:hypothetical protein